MAVNPRLGAIVKRMNRSFKEKKMIILFFKYPILGNFNPNKISESRILDNRSGPLSKGQIKVHDTLL